LTFRFKLKTVNQYKYGTLFNLTTGVERENKYGTYIYMYMYLTLKGWGRNTFVFICVYIYCFTMTNVFPL